MHAVFEHIKMTYLLHQLRLFFIALQFFTRLPIPGWVGFEAGWLQQASRYFPLVGLLVGILVAFFYLLNAWCWPAPVAVLLSTIFGIYITGAFHEDGFADVCDGFGGGMSPSQKLEIMQDSRVGAFGAIGITLLIGLKCLTLSYLPLNLTALGLMLAHPLSRLASIALIRYLPYVRPAGKVKPLAQNISPRSFLIAIVTGMVLPILIVSVGGMPWLMCISAVLAMAAAALLMGWRCMRHIDGYTGDCLGAVQQVAEVGIYLVLLACTTAGLT